MKVTVRWRHNKYDLLFSPQQKVHAILLTYIPDRDVLILMVSKDNGLDVTMLCARVKDGMDGACDTYGNEEEYY